MKILNRYLARFIITDDQGNDQTRTFRGSYSEIIDEYNNMMNPDDWLLHDAYEIFNNGQIRYHKGTIATEINKRIKKG